MAPSHKGKGCEDNLTRGNTDRKVMRMGRGSCGVRPGSYLATNFDHKPDCDTTPNYDHKPEFDYKPDCDATPNFDHESKCDHKPGRDNTQDCYHKTDYETNSYNNEEVTIGDHEEEA